MKSMGAGWENLKIQLALKGLNIESYWHKKVAVEFRTLIIIIPKKDKNVHATVKTVSRKQGSG